LYRIINEEENRSRKSSPSGMGFGRKTMKDICRSYGLTVTECIEKLAKHNITAVPNERLRTIAAQNGLLPRDIINIISK